MRVSWGKLRACRPDQEYFEETCHRRGGGRHGPIETGRGALTAATRRGSWYAWYCSRFPRRRGMEGLAVVVLSWARAKCPGFFSLFGQGLASTSARSDHGTKREETRNCRAVAQDSRKLGHERDCLVVLVRKEDGKQTGAGFLPCLPGSQPPIDQTGKGNHLDERVSGAYGLVPILPPPIFHPARSKQLGPALGIFSLSCPHVPHAKLVVSSRGLPNLRPTNRARREAPNKADSLHDGSIDRHSVAADPCLPST